MSNLKQQINALQMPEGADDFENLVEYEATLQAFVKEFCTNVVKSTSICDLTDRKGEAQAILNKFDAIPEA